MVFIYSLKSCPYSPAAPVLEVMSVNPAERKHPARPTYHQSTLLGNMFAKIFFSYTNESVGQVSGEHVGQGTGKDVGQVTGEYVRRGTRQHVGQVFGEHVD